MPRVDTMGTMADGCRVAIEEGPARRLAAVQEATFREVGESGEAQPWQVAERTDAVTLNAVPQLGKATAHRRDRNGKRKRHGIV